METSGGTFDLNTPSMISCFKVEILPDVFQEGVGSSLLLIVPVSMRILLSLKLPTLKPLLA